MAPSSSVQAGSTTSTSSVRRNLFTNHLSHRRPDPASTNHVSEPARNPSSLSNVTNGLPPRRPTSRTQSNDSLLNTSRNHRARSITEGGGGGGGGGGNNNNNNNNYNYNGNNDDMNGEIIARDRTGRPALPEIPILPPHLQLSSSEHQDAAPAEEGTSVGEAEGMELESAMREKEDQERIEKSLVDMMYRSRMRGNGHHGHGGGAGLGVENEELLLLVQASLRKKVASLEEDRWMFEGEVGDDYCYGLR